MKYSGWCRRFTENGMVPQEVSPKSIWGNKPSPLKRRSESISPLKKKINSRCPSTPPFRIHRSNNNRNNNWREKMWWRDTTLFKNNIVDICYLESIHILNKLKYRYLFIDLWVGVRTCNNINNMEIIKPGVLRHAMIIWYFSVLFKIWNIVCAVASLFPLFRCRHGYCKRLLTFYCSVAVLYIITDWHWFIFICV